MATDTTCNETDRSSDEAGEESAAARTPDPPRPPRPASRTSSGRVAIPMPPSRPRLEPMEGEGDEPLAEAAPAVDIEDERESPESKPPPARDTLPSGRRAARRSEQGLSAESAPAAPLTPRVSRPESLGSGAPRPSHRESQGLELDDEPEPTIVGKVSQDLLGLASLDEENTRAFTAPRELIELARRQREEGRGRRARDRQDQRETARPPARAAPAAASRAEPFSAPAVPIERLPAADEGGAAGAEPAPDVPVSSAPSVTVTPGSEPPGSGPPWSVPDGPVSAPPTSAAPNSIEVPISSAPSPRGRPSQPSSEALPSGSDFRTGGLRGFWLALLLLVLVGVVIARWNELARLLP